MPQSLDAAAVEEPTARKPRFRSAAICQALKHADIDLIALRTYAGPPCATGFDRINRNVSAEEKRFIKRAVRSLGLPAAKADRLSSDTQLIVEWYKTPGRFHGQLMSQQAAFESLATVSNALETVQSIKAADRVNVEQLARSLPAGDTISSTSLDLSRLHSDINAAARTIRRIQKILSPPGGRELTIRRDRCLALLVAAVVSATDAAITVSRRTKRDQARIFDSEPGHFVFVVMRLIGWTDEGALVDIFSRLQRELRRPA